MGLYELWNWTSAMWAMNRLTISWIRRRGMHLSQKESYLEPPNFGVTFDESWKWSKVPSKCSKWLWADGGLIRLFCLFSSLSLNSPEPFPPYMGGTFPAVRNSQAWDSMIHIPLSMSHSCWIKYAHLWICSSFIHSVWCLWKYEKCRAYSTQQHTVRLSSFLDWI